tara:strand:- start:16 stop:348 length:333 start_codon:yes stop_codon:yes gene_type:complete
MIRTPQDKKTPPKKEKTMKLYKVFFKTSYKCSYSFLFFADLKSLNEFLKEEELTDDQVDKIEPYEFKTDAKSISQEMNLQIMASALFSKTGLHLPEPELIPGKTVSKTKQ